MEKLTPGEKFARSKFVKKTKIGEWVGDIFITTKEYTAPKGKIVAKYVRSKLIFGKEKIVGGGFKRRKRKNNL